ncbi:hypothetical protein PPL_03185 [Heterostelium album PN500]|uniref:Uncharacterized protein n=1 Tax=Heterostelium pallidum (strain ATCC 26659 / Pp 5 / PN500) TaxID=670386 RepID=D3B464_HETP5|nr:hypothetical protein PPL_03185 [Heterostelium album PN500]EFA84112.1 hypothetical protein PPL_03185 [Heterostelium album PN500]|eukprot:XP_020436229.1 hypothetical protein PPL_03185 [Heterostelium album PN500]
MIMTGVYLKAENLPSLGLLCRSLKQYRNGLANMNILKQDSFTVPQYYLQFADNTDIELIRKNGIEISGNLYQVSSNPWSITSNLPNTLLEFEDYAVFNNQVSKPDNYIKDNDDFDEYQYSWDETIGSLPMLPFTVQQKIIEFCFRLKPDCLVSSSNTRVRSFGGDSGTVGILGWYSRHKLDLALVCWRFFNVVSQVVTRVFNVRNAAQHQPLNFFTHMTSKYCVIKRVTHCVSTNQSFAFKEHYIGYQNNSELAQQVYEDGVLACLELPVQVSSQKYTEILELDELLATTNYREESTRDLNIVYQRNYDGEFIDSNEQLSKNLQEDGNYQHFTTIIVSFRRNTLTSSSSSATLTLICISNFYKQLLGSDCNDFNLIESSINS